MEKWLAWVILSLPFGKESFMFKIVSRKANHGLWDSCKWAFIKKLFCNFFHFQHEQLVSNSGKAHRHLPLNLTPHSLPPIKTLPMAFHDFFSSSSSPQFPIIAPTSSHNLPTRGTVETKIEMVRRGILLLLLHLLYTYNLRFLRFQTNFQKIVSIAFQRLEASPRVRVERVWVIGPEKKKWKRARRQSSVSHRG